MKRRYWALITLAALILLGAGLLAFLDRPSVLGLRDAGQVGDYWGGHFSAAGALAAAILLLVAIFLQRDELIEQRKELALTREEMKLAREVSTVQAEQLTAQTNIAKNSATVSRILEVIRVRQLLVDSQRSLNLNGASHRARFRQIAREISRTDLYLQSLLQDRSLGDEEQNHLTKAVAIDDLETAIRNYVELDFQVASRGYELVLTITVQNRSPFPLPIGEVYFCYPVELDTDGHYPGDPPWTVQHVLIQPFYTLSGHLGSEEKWSYQRDGWDPHGRERVEAVPPDKFYVEVFTPDKDLRFTFDDGAEIKKRILSQMQSR